MDSSSTIRGTSVRKAFGLLLLSLSAFAPSLHAITIANSSYTAAVTYGNAVDGVNLSGVVEIVSNINGANYGCTGSLLTDGFSILTAGHCLTTGTTSAAASNVTVYFQGPNGMVAEAVSKINIDAAYSPGNSQNGSDLAVLTLTNMAPAFAEEYSLYSGNGALDTPLVMAGYGVSGTGTAGANGTFGTLQAGENEYMGNGYDFFHYSNQLLTGEFYDASRPSTNALSCSAGYVYSCSNATPYAGLDEVDISSGDSGGPTFYDGEIIGVHDLNLCVSYTNTSCAEPPAEGSTDTSYFGDLFADTSVAANLAFIGAAETGVPEPGSVALIAGGAFVWLGVRLRLGRG